MATNTSKAAELFSLEADDAAGRAAPRHVGVVTQDAALLTAIRSFGALRSLLRVSVVADGEHDDDMPAVSGRHELRSDGIRFTPDFAFQAGVRYQARFDPRLLGEAGLPNAATLAFSRPVERPSLPAKVTHVFPTADDLPENLLRFHACFSQPMQRGWAASEVVLLNADGQQVSDALYRAPIELWDRGMRRLTILLDPGRIKRNVGPNRALGPPLRAGQAYTLAIGAGMTCLGGHRLGHTVLRRFNVSAPVREAIPRSGWTLVPPAPGSRAPLPLRCSGLLDRASLQGAITVATGRGRRVRGVIEAAPDEDGFDFIPAAAWSAEPHTVSYQLP